MVPKEEASNSMACDIFMCMQTTIRTSREDGERAWKAGILIRHFSLLDAESTYEAAHTINTSFLTPYHLDMKHTQLAKHCGLSRSLNAKINKVKPHGLI